jgi:hypothetical protein
LNQKSARHRLSAGHGEKKIRFMVVKPQALLPL